MIQMSDTLNVDVDMRHMLELLKDHYNADEGHIIRALLRDRIKQISELKIL